VRDFKALRYRMLARSLCAVKAMGVTAGARSLSAAAAAAAAADGIPSHLRNLSGSAKPSVVLLYRCVARGRMRGCAKRGLGVARARGRWARI
jgi:hypothetical protein